MKPDLFFLAGHHLQHELFFLKYFNPNHLRACISLQRCSTKAHVRSEQD
jgi:hypothetical protein